MILGNSRWLAASRLAVLFSVSLITLLAHGDVTLPAVLADHMVVQRGLPVHVWGMAAADEAVTVTFRGESKIARGDELGRWSVYLSAGEAGGPFDMTVKGSNSIVLKDILVGDVWVASGQSNMELPLTRANNAQAEIAGAQFPKIRIFRVDRKGSEYPLDDLTAKTWAPCTPESVADSSAVAYFFAREIQQKTGVPIGLLESFWGGSGAESWTSLRALSTDASLMPIFATRNRAVENQATNLLRQAKVDRDYQLAMEQAKAQGKPAPPRPWRPDFGAWAPAAMFNAMIAPLTRFPIRGVIWYQGETNAGPDRAPVYARLFQTMIQDWRHAWNQGDFPFLFVQLPSWTSQPQDDWPGVREAQRQTLALRNTGMAITIDIGEPNNLHPTNKQDVGLRLALLARALVYGEAIESSGPLYRQLTQESHGLRVWFDHANGLLAKGAEVKGFEVAGADRKFSPAEAKIDGSSVEVYSPEVASPVYVRYGWAAAPDCNLYNREGLPASPFEARQ